MRYMMLSVSLIISTLAISGITAVHAAGSEDIIHAEWPEMDFTVAYDSFSKGDAGRAAYEVRRGSQFFKLAAEGSSGKIKKDLSNSYQELQQLANGIEKGTVKSPRELKKTFARAHLALAEYYQKQLEESWLARAEQKAGRDLYAATRNLERSLTWIGQEIEKGTASVIKEGYTLSRKLNEGIGWMSREAEKGIKDIGDEITALRRRIESGEKK